MYDRPKKKYPVKDKSAFCTQSMLNTKWWMVDAEEWNAFTALHRQMNHYSQTNNNKMWVCWMLKVHDAGRQPTWNDSTHHIFCSGENMIKKMSMRKPTKEKNTKTQTTWLWLRVGDYDWIRILLFFRFAFIFFSYMVLTGNRRNESEIQINHYAHPTRRKQELNVRTKSFHLTRITESECEKDENKKKEKWNEKWCGMNMHKYIGTNYWCYTKQVKQKPIGISISTIKCMYAIKFSKFNGFFCRSSSSF